MISAIECKSIEILMAKRQEALAAYGSIGLPDCAMYHFVKQGTFLSKRQQRGAFYFFQGLNTYPQNLSVFLRDQATRQNKIGKQKLVKGTFMIYDIYNKCDCVIEINIPGNMKIFKFLNNKKQVISNEEIDLMYISSVLRALYQKNLYWGRYFKPFDDGKDLLAQFTEFMKLVLKFISKKQIYISDEFQCQAQIKGSHSLTLILRFIKEKKIAQHVVQFMKTQIEKNPFLKEQKCPKVSIFMSQIYAQLGKFSKSIQVINALSKNFCHDPYMVYYKAKYLFNLLMIDDALMLLNSIVQYNQFQIWILLAKIHVQNKNFSDSIICLNHASKLSKLKQQKNIQAAMKSFEELGKPKVLNGFDPIQYHVRLSMKSQNPLGIPPKLVQQQFKQIVQSPYWKLNQKEKQIYRGIQYIVYRMEQKQFQQLLQTVFQQNSVVYNAVMFKKGLTQSMFVALNSIESTQVKQQTFSNQHSKKNVEKVVDEEQLPNFLQDQQSFQPSQIMGKNNNRNLSIIPEIQSVIQNSNYEQRQKQKESRKVRRKRQVNDLFYKILKVVLSQNQFQKAVYQNNYAKILPVYNKLRSCSKNNNFYAQLMFRIFSQTGNYNSIIVLIAQLLDFYESKGMKKMERLPYWFQHYIFMIISEKGLNFLNGLLAKLNFYDQAVIDSIQTAKKWRISGLTF